MSLFNFRRAGSAPANNAVSASQTESVDVIRRRAKHRLIGSVVLVLIGVIGFPLLFDTQPRPVGVDIPIEIPGKNTVKPLTLPATSSNTANPGGIKAESGAPADQKVATASSLGEREEIFAEKPAVALIKPAQDATKTEAKSEAKPDAKPAVKAEAEKKPELKPEVKPASRQTAAGDDGARARALLDGKNQVATTSTVKSSGDLSAPAAGEGRLIVQVGAYADASKVRDARAKLEKAGIKTYTQVTDSADGKRTRVRVGPFSTRADAEKAASKIKTLDLPAAILTL